MYSQEYLTQLKLLHAAKDRPRGFGGKVKDLGAFHTYMEQWNPNTVLDYGCGKGAILSKLQEQYPNTTWTGYDPAVRMFDMELTNKTFECIFCNDVLEHIEPEYLDTVLKNIFDLSSKYVWLRIDTLPARKKLSDGRNAHLILENKEWWTNKLNKYNFTIDYCNLNKKGKLDYALTR
jgi:SAM-dependent methyltransferase